MHLTLFKWVEVRFKQVSEAALFNRIRAKRHTGALGGGGLQGVAPQRPL